eukprot:jgi/Ulvmu1/6830/UM031_0034.1
METEQGKRDLGSLHAQGRPEALSMRSGGLNGMQLVHDTELRGRDWPHALAVTKQPSSGLSSDGRPQPAAAATRHSLLLRVAKERELRYTRGRTRQKEHVQS